MPVILVDLAALVAYPWGSQLYISLLDTLIFSIFSIFAVLSNFKFIKHDITESEKKVELMLEDNENQSDLIKLRDYSITSIDSTKRAQEASESSKALVLKANAALEEINASDHASVGRTIQEASELDETENLIEYETDMADPKVMRDKAFVDITGSK